MKKIIILIIIIIVLLSSCYGCNNEFIYEYDGEYADLYTIAVNSVLGARGYMAGETNMPLIEIVEEDKYGRIMFIYYEGQLIQNYDYALIISQKMEQDKVYFYPDYNLTIGHLDNSKPQDETTEDSGFTYFYPEYKYRAKFSDEQIEQLKIDNDWNKEIDLDKCIEKTIVRSKISPLKRKERIDFHKELFDNQRSDGDLLIKFLTQDSMGKYLFFASAGTRDAEYRAVIIHTNGEKKYIIITDIQNYQNELKKFKEENGWNKS